MKWRTNISLFVGMEIAYVALLAAAVRAPLGIALTAYVLAAVFTMPFFPIYLGLLAGLPHGWTNRRRRAAALAASPLLITPFVLFAFAGGFARGLMIIALPGAVAFGAAVRLPTARDADDPRRRRASSGVAVSR